MCVEGEVPGLGEGDLPGGGLEGRRSTIPVWTQSFPVEHHRNLEG